MGMNCHFGVMDIVAIVAKLCKCIKHHQIVYLPGVSLMAGVEIIPQYGCLKIFPKRHSSGFITVLQVRRAIIYLTFAVYWSLGLSFYYLYFFFGATSNTVMKFSGLELLPQSCVPKDGFLSPKSLS